MFTICIPGISTVLGIVGGLGCVGLCYVMPLLAILKMHPEQKIQGYVYILVTSILVAIGFGSSIRSVMSFF